MQYAMYLFAYYNYYSTYGQFILHLPNYVTTRLNRPTSVEYQHSPQRAAALLPLI